MNGVMQTRPVAAAAVLAVSGTVLAQGYGCVDTFENGQNSGGWTTGVTVLESVQPSGGAPGAWLSAAIDVVIPMVHTSRDSLFTGDLRAHHVTGVRASLTIFQAVYSAADAHPALLLFSNNGTPNNSNDDWAAYVFSTQTIGPAGEWRVHSFDVPSASDQWPAGWQYVGYGWASPTNPSWPWVMQHVTQMYISYTNPMIPTWEQVWPIGADEITLLQSGPSCYANCDGSTAAPLLNINDFACFLQKFVENAPYANCDGSTSPPVLNVNDFQCFLSAFVAGCP